jgi:hypothetical protein
VASAAGVEPAAGGAPVEIAPRSPVLVFRRPAGRADAAVSLALANRSDRSVRATDVVVSYWRAGERLRVDGLTPTVFAGDDTSRPRRIPPGARVEWAGICLDDPPEDAETARLEVGFSWRHGIAFHRARTTVEFALVPSPPPRVLRLPFDGHWLVTQGHGCGTNHRLGGFGGDFSWDFVHVGEDRVASRGGPGSGSASAENRSFGRKVLAPVAGEVVRVVNDVDDNEGLEDYPRRSLADEIRRPDWIFGNFVVLDAGDGAFVLVAHLEKGSVVVARGDRLLEGDPVARCGNSGNTVRAHLHLQVMDRADPLDPEVRGIPAIFSGYREVTFAGSAEQQDILMRRVSAGDPPEGALVSPLEEAP